MHVGSRGCCSSRQYTLPTYLQKQRQVFGQPLRNFRKKTGDTIQMDSDGMCQQARFEHKNTVVNTHIHGRLLQI